MLLTLMMVFSWEAPQQAPKKYTADFVRKLRREETQDQFDSMVQLGDKLFDAFEEILLDPLAEPRHVTRVFSLLKAMKIDRSQFHDLTLAKLADKTPGVRRTACELLVGIGSEKDGPVVAIMLLDGRTDVRYVAAETLAAIGGRRDLTAFDLIIRDADRYVDKQYMQPLLHPNDVKRYAECRAKLVKRLEEAEAKAKPPEKK